VHFLTDVEHRSAATLGPPSIAVVQSLLVLGHVDELQLAVAPALQMRGRKLFDVMVSRRVTLTRHVISPSGYLLLDCQVGN
jgi:hypothetical protein